MYFTVYIHMECWRLTIVISDIFVQIKECFFPRPVLALGTAFKNSVFTDSDGFACMPEGHGGAVTAQNAVNKRKKKLRSGLQGLGKVVSRKRKRRGHDSFNLGIFRAAIMMMMWLLHSNYVVTPAQDVCVYLSIGGFHFHLDGLWVDKLKLK